jgi:hypothetical protein
MRARLSRWRLETQTVVPIGHPSVTLTRMTEICPVCESEMVPIRWNDARDASGGLQRLVAQVECPNQCHKTMDGNEYRALKSGTNGPVVSPVPTEGPRDVALAEGISSWTI